MGVFLFLFILVYLGLIGQINNNDTIMAKVRRYCGPWLYEIEGNRIREYCAPWLYEIEGSLAKEELMMLIAILFA